MKLDFPSREFDETVAAICHGTASHDQVRGMNRLLRDHPAALDEYILRVELHSRLASEPDLFMPAEQEPTEAASAHHRTTLPRSALCTPRRLRDRRLRWAVALAVCFAMLSIGLWGMGLWWPGERGGTTSKAVAMLNRVVDAEWSQGFPRPGAPLDPGWLRLKSGLAQVVFYSGARVVIEGPTDLQIISPTEAACRSGRLTAEVPAQAHGFRIDTPQMNVTDLGTVFGLEVKERRTELHVFEGSVRFQPDGAADSQDLSEGTGAVVEPSGSPRLITANSTGFASLFDLQTKSTAAVALRYDQWRSASSRLNRDPSLLAHFDFEHATPSDWRLRNTSLHNPSGSSATIVGCQWIEGRWPAKPALEFHSVNDRVRLSVPVTLDALTLAAWIRVQGLDRKLNSLFMCDGFEPHTIHWLIRNDGVLGLTVIGQQRGDHQVFASPAVITLDQFGMWLHLAVVLDGNSKRMAHYVNGLQVSAEPLRVDPPFRIGVAELGNWNASGFPGHDALLIRNFSGAMDEFCLFGRALAEDEIRALYDEGKPQPDPVERR